MPRRKRYSLPAVDPPPVTDYERSVSIQEDFLQPLALEAQLVAELTDDEGLDPFEHEARRGRTMRTERERALAVARILPHRSTVNDSMAVVHERRFALWLQGVSPDEIQTIEDVDISAVERSLRYAKSLLSRDEVFRSNAMHTANRTHLEC